MKKDFYIFRHGETDFNKVRRWQGQKFDIELNENGIKQAQELASKIKDIGIEVIFTSPLKRARKTAEIASSEIKIPLFIEENLKEGCFGVAEGLTSEECRMKYADDLEKWLGFAEEHLDHSFPEGETKRQMIDRFLGVLNRLTKENYKKIGISAHGSMIVNLINRLGGELNHIPNTAVFHVRYDDGEWSVM